MAQLATFHIRIHCYATGTLFHAVLVCVCRDQANCSISSLLREMAGASAAGKSSQVTLHHLSDAELVRVLSCLGSVYRLSGTRKSAWGCLPQLASVDRRFRSLVHTQVAQKVLIDDTSAFTVPEDCPSAADNLLRNCKELCVSAAAAADLRNQTFTDLLSVKASSLISLSIVVATCVALSCRCSVRPHGALWPSFSSIEVPHAVWKVFAVS